jgi:hypothetical protein
MVTPRDVEALANRIKPLLAGHPAELQGAVLADLLAIWLAGHHVEGDEDATRKFRAELLSDHLAAVRLLTGVNARPLGMTP